VLGQHRSTQRKAPETADDEAALTVAIIDWARQYGRYGHRRVTALLRAEGWRVNHKRVERTWRREGLRVPARQPKRGRLWLNDGSCVRLRPERANHVWAYDFVEDRTRDGRKLRMLNVVDEFTRECLCIRVGRNWGHLTAVLKDALAPGSLERVHLAVKHLPLFTGGHPGVANQLRHPSVPNLFTITSIRAGYSSTNCYGVFVREGARFGARSSISRQRVVCREPQPSAEVHLAAARPRWRCYGSDLETSARPPGS
jgi:hypothetical protein